ncbi:serine/threonine protein kinase Ran1, partial [Coemansia sp. RSA 1853]
MPTLQRDSHCSNGSTAGHTPSQHTGDIASISEAVLPETETILSVLGMTCASCVNGIEQYLGSMDGISSIKVDLMTAQATVHHYKPIMTTEQLCTSIEGMGFDAQVLASRTLASKATGDESHAGVIEGDQPADSWFSVDGMTCGSCVATLTSLLTELPGVVSADVLLLTAQAMVRHIPREIGVREITNVISDAGFTVAPLDTGADDGTGMPDPSA